MITWTVENIYIHFVETWCIYFEDGDGILYSYRPGNLKSHILYKCIRIAPAIVNCRDIY
jgi:hypothetical protein